MHLNIRCAMCCCVMLQITPSQQPNAGSSLAVASTCAINAVRLAGHQSLSAFTLKTLNWESG